MVYRVATLALLTGLLASCRTVSMAEDIHFYALEADVSDGEQVGVVRAYDCGTRVLGFGPRGKLTKAFETLKQRDELRYMTRMKVYRRYRSWVFFDRDCWVVRGIGYK